MVPPNHPPSGISSPGGAQADPARAVPACTAPVACLESRHTPAARRAAVPGTRAVQPRTWDLGPRTPDARGSHSGRLPFCMCLFHILAFSFFLSSPLVTFIAFVNQKESEEGKPWE